MHHSSADKVPSWSCSRYKSGQNHLTEFIGVEPSKKRKRRTSFTPQALELLNAHFERNTHPSGTIINIYLSSPLSKIKLSSKVSISLNELIMVQRFKISS